MAELLRALIVEDSADDAELVARELNRGGFRLESRRVDTAEGLRTALRACRWDAVISDFAMPGFSGLEALSIVREHDQYVPFILVSGSIGEDVAVGAMKAGAQDYIMKDRLARLAPAVARELVETQNRRERRRLEEQFRRTQKLEAVGQLASGVAHEFNNILMGISGYAQLLAGQPGLDAEALEDIERIRKLAARGGGLSRQLLTFSRAEEGEKLVLDIVPLVKSAVRMLRRVLPENISVAARCDRGTGRMCIDPGQLEQVIVNLAVNARDAMPDGGELVIGVRNVTLNGPSAGSAGKLSAGSYVLLAMSDTGCGMDAATAARVFEPFFTTKESSRGTGLGLSTVYGIVTGHGGHVTVYSEPDKGSVFKLYFPRVADEETQLAEPAAAATPVTATSAAILVAEDDESVRNVLSTYLSGRGYQVLAAADPDEAEQMARSHRGEFELLVSDVTMPKRSGPELYQRLLAICPAIQALFISGYFKEGSPLLQRLPAETGFLQKPFSLSDLGKKIEEMLTGGRTPED
jgi:signal transduction histidine kinase